MSSAIENEIRFLQENGFPIHPYDKIVEMARGFVHPDEDEYLKPGFMYGNLLDILVPLSLQYNCERALNVPYLTKGMLDRYYERETHTKWEHLEHVFNDFPALAVCFPKYWARSGVPERLKKDLARLVFMHQKVLARCD